MKSVSRESSDRKSWDNIFKSLVKILQTKQDHIESLLKDRKTLEDKIKTKHESWISDVRNYDQQLSLMKREIETMEMMQFLETSKFNLLSVLKERDRSICNLKSDETVDELKYFKAWFDILTSKENGDSEAAESLEAKIRKLKLEYEKKCEISDLLRENGFARSEFKCIESGFIDKLKRKDDEIAQANAKISSLVSYQEQLLSSNHEKDEIISSLKAKVAELEGGFTKKGDEGVSKLSRDVESLNKSRSLTRCTTRDKGSDGNTVGSQEIRRSKRQKVNKTSVTVSETPKLFTSTFRLPKLKSPPSSGVGAK